MDFANPQDGGPGETLTAATVKTESGNWREQDYAWTHSAPVEGFFIVLTIAIVPVAILRWLRRLPSRTVVVGGRRRLDADT
jgi:hypothetical protein